MVGSRLNREDGYVIEATWKDGEMNGYARLRYNREQLPKCLDPIAAATTVLSYSGYLKDSRMHGDGLLVT